jgi:PAS domain S-box-containing protein
MPIDPRDDTRHAIDPDARGAVRLVALYAAVASVWLACIDRLLLIWVPDPARRENWEIAQQAAFVVVTSVTLYGLIRHLLDQQQVAFQAKTAALQERDRSLRLLQAIADNSPDAIFAKDLEGRYLLFNQAAARWARRPVAQVLGADDTDLFEREQASMLRSHDQRVMAMNRAETFEESVDTALGRVTLAATKGPLHNAQGEVVGIFGISRDITQRRAAEDALRLSEQKFRLAASLGQVWDWNIQTGQTTFSHGFWDLFDVEIDANGKAIEVLDALTHPDDRERRNLAMREHLARRAPYQLQFRARRDGAAGTEPWRWFQTQGQAVWNEEGKATYAAGTTFEITERKLVELALLESEAYRRGLFEQLADGVILTDEHFQIIDANPQIATMLGYSRSELLRKKSTDLVASARSAGVGAAVQAMSSGRPHLANWDLVRKDGSLVPVEVNARAIDSSRWLGVMRDVSTRRAAEAAMQALQVELAHLAQRSMSQEKTTTERIALALHDHVGQTLAVARLSLDACISGYAASMPPVLKDQAEKISAMLNQAVLEVRQVLAELRPPMLEAHGLSMALENELCFRSTSVGGPDVLLEVADAATDLRWPADVEYAAFMVAREATTNALLHADASLIRVLLEGDAQSLCIVVVDDGVGMAASTAASGKRPGGHLGFVGMRERCAAIGAQFSVDAEAPNGTRVSLFWKVSSS